MESVLMRNPLKSTHSTSLGLLLVRLPVGILFLLAGIMKYKMGVSKFVDMSIGAAGPFMPEQLGRAYLYALPTVESLVGVLIIVGWFTRTTGLVASLIMISIVIAVTGVKGEGGGIHSNVILLGVTLLLLFAGPGGYALDSLRFGRSKGSKASQSE
jgi:uncharacterized membrane protein YphA (DoxX/SURF4 family)